MVCVVFSSPLEQQATTLIPKDMPIAQCLVLPGLCVSFNALTMRVQTKQDVLAEFQRRSSHE